MFSPVVIPETENKKSNNCGVGFPRMPSLLREGAEQSEAGGFYNSFG